MSKPIRKSQPKEAQGGFTLIELLMVVAIIGIIAAISVPQYLGYITRSANSACLSEASSWARRYFIESQIPNGDIEAINIPWSACETPEVDDSNSTASISPDADGPGDRLTSCDLETGSCALALTLARERDNRVPGTRR